MDESVTTDNGSMTNPYAPTKQPQPQQKEEEEEEEVGKDSKYCSEFMSALKENGETKIRSIFMLRCAV